MVTTRGNYPKKEVLALRSRYLTSQKYVDDVLDGEMIGDEVINFYLHRIMLRNERANTLGAYPKLMVYTTYFYPLLVKNGFTSGRPCHLATKDASPFDFELLLIPIHDAEKLHWTMISVHVKDKKIEHYDSLKCSDADTIIRTILEFLHHEARKQKVPFKEREWISVVANGPLQNNGLDCGAFICAWAGQRATHPNDKVVHFPHSDSAIRRFRRNLICHE